MARLQLTCCCLEIILINRCNNMSIQVRQQSRKIISNTFQVSFVAESDHAKLPLLHLMPPRNQDLYGLISPRQSDFFSSSSDTLQSINTMAAKYIYWFHVPFFFLISGLLHSSAQKIPRFIAARFKHLMVPYCVLVCCALIMIVTGLYWTAVGKKPAAGRSIPA